MSASTTPEPQIHVAVDMIVLTLRDEQLSVLLVQRHDAPYGGAWALPGGFIEVGEDIEAAAYRVLADEASLGTDDVQDRSEEHTSELQSRGHLVCRLLLEGK